MLNNAFSYLDLRQRERERERERERVWTGSKLEDTS